MSFISGLFLLYGITLAISGGFTAFSNFKSNERIILNGYNVKYPTQISLWDNVKYYLKNYRKLLIPFRNIGISFKNVYKTYVESDAYDTERMAALRNAGRLEDPKPVKPLLKTIDQRRAEEEAAKKEATPETPVVVKKEKTVEEMTAQEKMTYYTSQYENVKALFKASKDKDEKARLCQLAQIYCDGFRAAQAEIERMKLLDSIKSTRDGLADIPVLGR